MPTYADLLGPAVQKFTQHSGLDVIVIQTKAEAGFSVKLNLDLLVGPSIVVFCDVDLWLVRAVDFSVYYEPGRFGAVWDPSVNNTGTFCHKDVIREGWNPENYFNSGLFVCDMADPKIRQVFADAREHLRACHAGEVEKPADWTDQYFLNAAVRRQPGLFKRLPPALNFYKVCADWGSSAFIPRAIIGLHAAGIPLAKKLATLQAQEAVFGGPVRPLLGAARHQRVEQTLPYPVMLLAKEGVNARRDYALEHVRERLLVYPEIVDGPDKKAPDFESRIDPATQRDTITDGGLACTMGHRAMWQRIVDRQLKYALLLEDDIALTEDTHLLESTFAELERRAEHQWDWVQFRGPNLECAEDDLELVARGEDGYFADMHYAQRARRLPWQNVCYGVSLKGAKRLLELTAPITKVNDCYIRFCHNEVAFQGPVVASQNREFTSFVEYDKTTGPWL